MRSFQKAFVFVGVVASALLACPADAGVVVPFTDPSGLAGEAEFDLINATTLQVRLRNTSTGVPVGFNSADQLLTSCAFLLNGGVSITGGTVFTGATSSSINFDVASVGSNADVSGEWGFGNNGNTGYGALLNSFSSNNAQVDPFGLVNLDGPTGLDGPQGGLVANPAVVDLGGLGAIQDEVVATLNLSGGIADLSFLDNGVVIEFGSDAAFLIPAPGALALLALAGLVGVRRRRS
jgi:hypothetical protein